MKKIWIILITLSGILSCKNTEVVQSEPVVMDTIVVEPEKKPIYRASRTRKADILHTKLQLSFNWDSAWVLGEAEITLKPYFYALDQVELDAKGMEIAAVGLKIEGENKPLKFEYDDFVLSIALGREMTREEQAVLYIKYTAKPNEIASIGSAAIAGDKGLYFINHDNSDPNKPRQLWTQGETEANSCWFPTIDSPNEKMTTEIYVTIEEAFTSISNGMRMFRVSNSDGTKTEYWKMEQPHAPYLVMLAVGPFAEYNDEWNDMEVNYYLDSAYLEYAQDIFGNTPEMLTFYSDYLGVKYPWPKYDQVVVHDYVSGAMENTTATIHGEFLQQTSREMIDYDNEDVIAHELFHHWFGDLITCESWSNLTLNEGFATYGEHLWSEYKYGVDEADWQIEQDLKVYISESKYSQQDLVRFHYDFRDDMFDSHSYSKGGRVLHMLRQYVGEDAFRASLKHFLTKHAYKTVEIHDLRIAFEEVTGEDLNWFFNQWFLASGHPVINVSWAYNETTKEMTIYTSQEQDPERTPIHTLYVPIEVHSKGELVTETLKMSKAMDTFHIQLNGPPSYLNFDPRNFLLCEQFIEQPIESWQAMFQGSERYADRKEALMNLMDTVNFSTTSVFLSALDDPFWAIRGYALSYAKEYLSNHEDVNFVAKLKAVAQKDENSLVRARAIDVLSTAVEDSTLISVYEAGMQDSSYSVLNSSFLAICEIDSIRGKELAKDLEAEKELSIVMTIADLYAGFGLPEDLDYFEAKRKEVSDYGLYGFIQSYGQYIAKQDDAVFVSQLPYFKKMALENNTWWVRLSAMMVLMENHGRLILENAQLQQSLSDMDESNPNYTIISQSLEAREAAFLAVDDIWQQVTETEQHPQLVGAIADYNRGLAELKKTENTVGAED